MPQGADQPLPLMQVPGAQPLPAPGRPIEPLRSASVTRKLLLTALATSALFAASAARAENCLDSTTTPSYLSCAGSFTGNLNGSASELTSLTTLFGGTWTYGGKSDDSGSGPFTSNPGGSSGTLTFDTAMFGTFVIGLKAATQYSFFRFDGGSTGITTIDFDTFGVAQNGQGIAQALSHAALYLGTGVPGVVAEPETYALLLAGLGVLGFVARRRRR